MSPLMDMPMAIVVKSLSVHLRFWEWTGNNCFLRMRELSDVFPRGSLIPSSLLSIFKKNFSTFNIILLLTPGIVFLRLSNNVLFFMIYNMDTASILDEFIKLQLLAFIKLFAYDISVGSWCIIF